MEEALAGGSEGPGGYMGMDDVSYVAGCQAMKSLRNQKQGFELYP